MAQIFHTGEGVTAQSRELFDPEDHDASGGRYPAMAAACLNSRWLYHSAVPGQCAHRFARPSLKFG